MVSISWQRGVILGSVDNRWIQIHIGRGSVHRRLLWWPRLMRTVSLRLISNWWLNVVWNMRPKVDKALLED